TNKELRKQRRQIGPPRVMDLYLGKRRFEGGFRATALNLPLTIKSAKSARSDGETGGDRTGEAADFPPPRGLAQSASASGRAVHHRPEGNHADFPDPDLLHAAYADAVAPGAPATPGGKRRQCQHAELQAARPRTARLQPDAAGDGAERDAH